MEYNIEVVPAMHSNLKFFLQDVILLKRHFYIMGFDRDLL